MVGQKKYGKVMKGKDILKENISPKFHYLVDFSQNDENKLINKNIQHQLFNNIFNDNLHFMCSWFIGLEYDTFEKLGYNCNYYDIDKFVCDANRHLTDNVYNIDVVFDNITIDNGIIINKYCENTYPLGKIYKGTFILIGSDNPHLANINNITSCDQLIEQNNITKVIDTKHFKMKHNYYLVSGCNI